MESNKHVYVRHRGQRSTGIGMNTALYTEGCKISVKNEEEIVSMVSSVPYGGLLPVAILFLHPSPGHIGAAAFKLSY